MSYMAMPVILHVPGHLVVAFLLPRLASFDFFYKFNIGNPGELHKGLFSYHPTQ